MLPTTNGLASNRRISTTENGEQQPQPQYLGGSHDYEHQQRLPNEIFRIIFLYCDPATLYTSIRPIGRAWKTAVEQQLIASHFANRDWRVGLRVVRKLPAPTSPSFQQQQHHGVSGSSELDRFNILERGGVEEPIEATVAASAAPLQPQSVHVIPLRFKGYDEENVSLLFDTQADWHSLFRVQQPTEDEEESDGDEDEDDEDAAVEDDDDSDSDSDSEATSSVTTTSPSHRRRIERAEAKASSARLEADFGLVWRFPDDGQDADPVAGGAPADEKNKPDDAASWGVPDPENGWLSRFYCSRYDLKQQQPPSSPLSHDLETESDADDLRSLRSTPIAPRTRRRELHPHFQRSMAAIDGSDGSDVSTPASRDDDEQGRGDGANSLVWSDEGHEYLNLSLSLGMEFFVRRSARANQLLRRLEAEAAAADARDAMQASTSPSKGGSAKAGTKKCWGAGKLASTSASASASGWVTPKEVASPPPSRTTASLDARRMKQPQQPTQKPRVQQIEDLLSSECATGPSSRLLTKSRGKQIASEIEELEAPLPSGAVTPAAMSSSSPSPSSLSLHAMSRLASVAPTRRGGGTVATTSMTTKVGGTRRGNSSTPRATFSARLCRAELMPSQPLASACRCSDEDESEREQVDVAGWRGGDALGKGAFRLARAQGGIDSGAYQRAAIRAGVPPPAIWSWTR